MGAVLKGLGANFTLVFPALPGGLLHAAASRLEHRYSPQGAIVRAEDIQLLLVFSAHAFFLSLLVVETREASGAESASAKLYPDGTKGMLSLGKRAMPMSSWRG